MLQHLVARHDAALHFIDHNLSPKLDECAPFVQWDGTGVRLKRVEDFLV
jgi:hypothetical protein